MRSEDWLTKPPPLAMGPQTRSDLMPTAFNSPPPSFLPSHQRTFTDLSDSTINLLTYFSIIKCRPNTRLLQIMIRSSHKYFTSAGETSRDYGSIHFTWWMPLLARSASPTKNSSTSYICRYVDRLHTSAFTFIWHDQQNQLATVMYITPLAFINTHTHHMTLSDTSPYS